MTSPASWAQLLSSLLNLPYLHLDPVSCTLSYVTIPNWCHIWWPVQGWWIGGILARKCALELKGLPSETCHESHSKSTKSDSSYILLVGRLQWLPLLHKLSSWHVFNNAWNVFTDTWNEFPDAWNVVHWCMNCIQWYIKSIESVSLHIQWILFTEAWNMWNMLSGAWKYVLVSMSTCIDAALLNCFVNQTFLYIFIYCVPKSCQLQNILITMKENIITIPTMYTLQIFFQNTQSCN